MKKKSNRNLLIKYIKKRTFRKEELLAKKSSQIEAQKKILDLIGKITFWEDYEC